MRRLGWIAVLVASALVPATAFASASALAEGRVVELTAQSPDSVSLAGALYLPAGPGPSPAVILIHGSEPGTRSHPGYQRWAQRMQAAGIACLIFDKRGAGDSEGTYVEAPDLSVPAGDVLAWVTMLLEHPAIRRDAVGVLGWSQGGWIGPLAASQSEHIAFVVAISGPGVSPLEQNIFDKSNRFRGRGLTPEQEAQAGRVVRQVMSYLTTGEGREGAKAAWDSVKTASWFEEHYDGIPLINRQWLLENPEGQLFLAHNRYDPVPVLESLTVPMLAVFGDADRIVPVDASVRAMRAAFAKSGNPGLSVLRYPGADHGIRVRGSDGERRLAPGYLDAVLDWILTTVGAARPGGHEPK